MEIILVTFLGVMQENKSGCFFSERSVVNTFADEWEIVVSKKSK